MARLAVSTVLVTVRRCTSPAHILLFSYVLAVFLRFHPVSGEKNHLRDITDANWEEILEGEWMVEFFAPWCPACKELQPLWDEFAEWGEDMGINIGKVDVTEQPGLSGRFGITSLPTIYHCKDGAFRVYEGPRTKDDFLSFINEKKWQDIQPMSSWFAPSSLLMNSVSVVFRLSVSIRHWHSYLTEQLGLPTWASYGVFLLTTLLSGLLLGLFLVVITDFVWPSRHLSPQHDYYQRSQTLDQARQRKQLEDEEDESEEDDTGGQMENMGHLRRRKLGAEEEEQEEEDM